MAADSPLLAEMLKDIEDRENVAPHIACPSNLLTTVRTGHCSQDEETMLKMEEDDESRQSSYTLVTTKNNTMKGNSNAENYDIDDDTMEVATADQLNDQLSAAVAFSGTRTSEEEEDAEDNNSTSKTSTEDIHQQLYGLLKPLSGDEEDSGGYDGDKKRKYVCQHCHKGFSLMNVLKVHERIHTGEKPYTCEICNKAFNQSGSLNRHRNTHKKRYDNPSYAHSSQLQDQDSSVYSKELSSFSHLSSNRSPSSPLPIQLSKVPVSSISPLEGSPVTTKTSPPVSSTNGTTSRCPLGSNVMFVPPSTDTSPMVTIPLPNNNAGLTINNMLMNPNPYSSGLTATPPVPLGLQSNLLSATTECQSSLPLLASAAAGLRAAVAASTGSAVPEKLVCEMCEASFNNKTELQAHHQQHYVQQLALMVMSQDPSAARLLFQGGSSNPNAPSQQATALNILSRLQNSAGSATTQQQQQNMVAMNLLSRMQNSSSGQQPQQTMNLLNQLQSVNKTANLLAAIQQQQQAVNLFNSLSASQQTAPAVQQDTSSKRDGATTTITGDGTGLLEKPNEKTSPHRSPVKRFQNGKRTHLCRYCGKYFSQNGTLKRHYQTCKNYPSRTPCSSSATETRLHQSFTSFRSHPYLPSRPYLNLQTSTTTPSTYTSSVTTTTPSTIDFLLSNASPPLSYRQPLSGAPVSTSNNVLNFASSCSPSGSVGSGLSRHPGQTTCAQSTDAGSEVGSVSPGNCTDGESGGTAMLSSSLLGIVDNVPPQLSVEAIDGPEDLSIYSNTASGNQSRDTPVSQASPSPPLASTVSPTRSVSPSTSISELGTPKQPHARRLEDICAALKKKKSATVPKGQLKSPAPPSFHQPLHLSGNSSQILANSSGLNNLPPVTFKPGPNITPFTATISTQHSPSQVFAAAVGATRVDQCELKDLMRYLTVSGKLYRCDYCQIFFLDSAMFHLHRGMHQTTAGPYTCAICSFQAEDKYNFQLHFMEHATNSQSSQKDSEALPTENNTEKSNQHEDHKMEENRELYVCLSPQSPSRKMAANDVKEAVEKNLSIKETTVGLPYPLSSMSLPTNAFKSSPTVLIQ